MRPSRRSSPRRRRHTVKDSPDYCACRVQLTDADLVPLWYSLPESFRVWIRRAVLLAAREQRHQAALASATPASKETALRTSGRLLPFFFR